LIEIVEAGAERIDDVEPLWRALLEHQAPLLPDLGKSRLPEESWRRRRAHYEQLLSQPGAFVLIAERDGRPVGYAMVELSRPSQSWEIDHAANLETLSVLPEERAAGVGTALMERVRERLREAGVTHLGASVVDTNERALRFYRRHGFEPAFVEMIARL
jgi:ribosomal protein S18 acetylase RimI-like enzyme